MQWEHGLFGRLMHVSASESNTIISYPLLPNPPFLLTLKGQWKKVINEPYFVTRNRVYCVTHQTGLIQLKPMENLYWEQIYVIFHVHFLLSPEAYCKDFKAYQCWTDLCFSVNGSPGINIVKHKEWGNSDTEEKLCLGIRQKVPDDFSDMLQLSWVRNSCDFQ